MEGILVSGGWTLGCSGAIEVASELMLVADPVVLVAVVVVVAGESILEG